MNADAVFQQYRKHLQRAELLMEVGRWREALHELNLHRSDHPDDYYALCQSALCYLELKEYQNGYDTTKKAIEVSPEDEWAYRLQSIIFRENGEEKRALDAAEICVQKAPYLPSAMETLFYAQAGYGKLDEAQKSLDALLEMGPGDLASHLAAGFLALKQSKYQDAEKHFLEALKIDANSVNALNNLGVTYLRLYQARYGDIYREKSVEMFERAVKTEPTFKLGQQNIKTAKSAVRKVGFPIGLGWGLCILSRVINVAVTNVSSSHASIFEVLSPSSSNPLLVILNFYLILVLLLIVGLAAHYLITKQKIEILNHFKIKKGWLILLCGTSVPAILYTIVFVLVDEQPTPLSLFGWLIFCVATVYAVIGCVKTRQT